MEAQINRKLELRHFRYVIATADFGSIRRAALALGVQPSSVSRRIRDLEDEIGASLFIRQRSGARLTFAGERFLARARKAMKLLGNAAKDVEVIGRGEVGVVRLGFVSSLTTGFLSDLLDQYERCYPSVAVEYVEGSPRQHADAVEQHRMDAAFLAEVEDVHQLDSINLWTEPIYVAMATSDVLADKDELVWADLAGRKFVVSDPLSGSEIHAYLDKHLTKFGAAVQVEHHAVFRDTILQLIAKGSRLTLMSEANVDRHLPGIAYRPLQGERVSFHMIWSPSNDNPALRRMIAAAKTLAKRSASRSFTQPGPVALSQMPDQLR